MGKKTKTAVALALISTASLLSGVALDASALKTGSFVEGVNDKALAKTPQWDRELQRDLGYLPSIQASKSLPASYKADLPSAYATLIVDDFFTPAVDAKPAQSEARDFVPQTMADDQAIFEVDAPKDGKLHSYFGALGRLAYDQSEDKPLSLPAKPAEKKADR